MAFLVVGLTGGIGSGKSTVARLFAEFGVPVVDADQVARDVVEPGTDGLRELVATFGETILSADGRLDRKALGDRVFGDDDERRKLEAILHPRIGMESLRQLSALDAAGHPYALYEAALLVETGRHETMGALVVVSVDAQTQRERVMQRDALDETQAQARIDSQLPLADKVAVADFVVHNDGTLDATKTQVAEVHAALLARTEGAAS